MRRLLAALLLTAAALPAALVVAAPGAEPAGPRQPPESAVAELLAAGEEAYAWRCAVCHGVAGGGIEEARQRFPPDERRCTRCHRPSNRVVQPLDQPFDDNDMFSIGEPPALHPTADRPAALAATAAPEALHAYLQATMPRYDPGSLTAAEYWAVTAYLLEMNDRSAELPRVLELAALE